MLSKRSRIKEVPSTRGQTGSPPALPVGKTVVAMPPEEDDPDRTRTSFVRALKSKDGPDFEAAWIKMYNKHWDKFIARGLRSGLNHSDAEDAAQKAMTDFLKRIERFEKRDRPGSFRAFMNQLVKWRISEIIRRPPSLELPPEPGVLKEDDGTEFLLEIMEEGLKTLHQLGDISSQAYQVIQLRFFEGQPSKLVSEALGIPKDRVDVITHRTKKQLGTWCREWLKRFHQN